MLESNQVNTHTHTHSTLHILFPNRIKERTLKQKTCIIISDVIYNPYITGMTINSTHTHINKLTHTYTHTLPYLKPLNRKQTGI